MSLSSAANRTLKHPKPLFSEWKTEVRPRTHWKVLALPPLIGLQNRLCSALVFKKSDGETQRILPILLFCTTRPQYSPITLAIQAVLCNKNGFLSFSLGKLTLLGGHELILPFKFCLFEVQICTLNRSCGYSSAFCREPWCSPNCSRASISCIKLSTSAYSWHMAAKKKKIVFLWGRMLPKRLPVLIYMRSMQSLPKIHKTFVFLKEKRRYGRGSFVRFWPYLPLLGS